MIKVSAILLAAGLSDRMQGPNKLLMHLHGRAIIERTYWALQHSRVDRIVVVTGRDQLDVQGAIKLEVGDGFVHNDAFRSGMTSSIQTGLEKLLDTDAVMICLGDMPLLTSKDYNALIETFSKKSASDKILVPWFKAHRANPVIFGSDYFKEILNHQPPNGCAGIIKNHSQKVLNLKVDNERFIRDVDTADDFKQLETNAE